jgi:putative phosphoesterase
VADRFWIGVVSDTHGLLRPEVLSALAESQPHLELILHAGDVGSVAVIDALSTVAPVRAVRGNVDGPPLSRQLPETDLVEVAGVSLYLIHDLARLDLEPVAAGVGAVIFGHSHAPASYRRDGVLFFNPGSAGPRRFDLPVSLGRIGIDPRRRELQADHLTLER